MLVRVCRVVISQRIVLGSACLDAQGHLSSSTPSMSVAISILHIYKTNHGSGQNILSTIKLSESWPPQFCDFTDTHMFISACAFAVFVAHSAQSPALFCSPCHGKYRITGTSTPQKVTNPHFPQGPGTDQGTNSAFPISTSRYCETLGPPRNTPKIAILQSLVNYRIAKKATCCPCQVYLVHRASP
jgi:hypothetical protein